MKCYYEVLEISREADDGEIKTAYRKLALRWHPDKNLSNEEEAKVQFQLVQQAYEVLSDRQERAWYDKHREQILRGSNKDFKDDSLDVYEYFTTSCFKGYGDDKNGFYAVYRKVFEDITKEDIEHMDSKSDYDEIPAFGNSTSDYDDIVGPFYAYWSSYTTKKSYVWLDIYNINEARNSKEVKLIEKENNKVRQKAKKERNEEVRNLVAFVRKRDKRVQAHTKLLEAKVAENRLKQEQMRKQKILENKKELDNHKSAEWSKFDNVKKELKEIEKNLAEQFGESLSDSESNSEIEEDTNDLYCVACNKVFKNPKAFANHESSKKHLQNVEILRQSMLEEEQSSENESEIMESDESDINELYCFVCDKEFKTPKAFANHASSKKHIENIEKLKQETNTEENVENLEDNEYLEEEVSDLEEPLQNQPKKKNKKAKKVIRTQKLSVNEEGSEVHFKISEISDEDHDFKDSKKSKKKKDVKKTPKPNKDTEKVANENGTVGETPEQKVAENDNQTQAKKRMKKGQKKNIITVTKSDLEEIDITHCCVVCKSNFSSKNKLFDHLKKTGHSIALPDNPVKSKKRAK